MIVYLYGPPGSGKSTVGKRLADALALPFFDLDEQIASQAGWSVVDIFALEGEASFRARESAALTDISTIDRGIIALGGGALLAESNRILAEATGRVICLTAPADILASRLADDANYRPLLAKQSQSAAAETGMGDRYTEIISTLISLLARRTDHYAGFQGQLDTAGLSSEQAAWQAQVQMGAFKVSGMGVGYDVRVIAGGLVRLGELLHERKFYGPIALVSDSHVAPIYGHEVMDGLQQSGFNAQLITMPAGEQHKTLTTLQNLWSGFLEAGLERRSTVVALGGGVVSDLAGFAAATYLRGVNWVALPTSLLAMIDASLGGKTGADLPQGKNLIGAFHAPSLVMADPSVLATLPDDELRSGLAEVVKHGLIGDPALFALCELGWPAILEHLDEIVRRAMAVKIKVIQDDPYEQGVRATLNLGHTLGHAIELASDYHLRHGEGVGIGLVAAARYAGRLGIAETGLAERIQGALVGLGLPVEVPAGLDRGKIISAMGVDKKRRGSKVHLALPVRVGEVQFGVVLDNPEELLN